MIWTVWALVWTVAVALAVAATVRLRRRLRAQVDRRPMLDDDDVNDIIAFGFYVSQEDEPLDLERAREEERRFWEEAEWDEAEEW